jgi:hypothetical protein
LFASASAGRVPSQEGHRVRHSRLSSSGPSGQGAIDPSNAHICYRNRAAKTPSGYPCSCRRNTDRNSPTNTVVCKGFSEGLPPIRPRPSKPVPNGIVRDAKYPNMYRLRLPDGSLSDMVNLTRAKDALAAFSE